jgi:hypothetical protein
MKTIRKRIKEAQDRHKSYANVHHVDRNYEVGDQVFLQVKPQKILIKCGKGVKLSPRFVGPFQVVERWRKHPSLQRDNRPPDLVLFEILSQSDSLGPCRHPKLFHQHT